MRRQTSKTHSGGKGYSFNAGYPCATFTISKPTVMTWPGRRTTYCSSSRRFGSPFALAGLDELQELDLADNQLSTVIGVLRKLPALRHCRLARNPLPGEQISQLRSELPEVEFITSER